MLNITSCVKRSSNLCHARRYVEYAVSVIGFELAPPPRAQHIETLHITGRPGVRALLSPDLSPVDLPWQGYGVTRRPSHREKSATREFSSWA